MSGLGVYQNNSDFKFSARYHQKEYFRIFDKDKEPDDEGKQLEFFAESLMTSQMEKSGIKITIGDGVTFDEDDLDNMFAYKEDDDNAIDDKHAKIVPKKSYPKIENILVEIDCCSFDICSTPSLYDNRFTEDKLFHLFPNIKSVELKAINWLHPEEREKMLEAPIYGYELYLSFYPKLVKSITLPVPVAEGEIDRFLRRITSVTSDNKYPQWSEATFVSTRFANSTVYKIALTLLRLKLEKKLPKIHTLRFSYIDEQFETENIKRFSTFDMNLLFQINPDDFTKFFKIQAEPEMRGEVGVEQEAAEVKEFTKNFVDILEFCRSKSSQRFDYDWREETMESIKAQDLVYLLEHYK